MKPVVGRGTVSLEEKSLGTGPLLQDIALQRTSEREDRPTRGFQPARFPRLIAPPAIGVSGAEQELAEESQINSFSSHSGFAHTSSRPPSSLRVRKDPSDVPQTRNSYGERVNCRSNARAARVRWRNAAVVARESKASGD